MGRVLVAAQTMPRSWSPALYKMHVMLFVCDAGTQEVDAGSLEVQGHPFLCGKLKASLSYVKFCLKWVSGLLHK